MKGRLSLKTQENIFNKILEYEENKVCADCSAKAPRWASIDFGVFICMNCAGIHRTIGPHITRVRSTILDTWTEDIMDIVVNIGNKIANNYWEFKPPGPLKKPTINSTPQDIQKFVNDKYIRKLYSPSGFSDPVKEFKESKSTQITKEIKPPEEQINQKLKDVKLPPPSNTISKASDVNRHQPAVSNTTLQNVPKSGQDLLSMEDDDELFGEFNTAQVETHSQVSAVNTATKPNQSSHSLGPATINSGSWPVGGQTQPTNMQGIPSITPVKAMNFSGINANGIAAFNGMGITNTFNVNNMALMNPNNTVALVNNQNMNGFVPTMGYAGMNHMYMMNSKAGYNQMPGMATSYNGMNSNMSGINPGMNGFNPGMNNMQMNHFQQSSAQQLATSNLEKQNLKGENILAMYGTGGNQPRMY